MNLPFTLLRSLLPHADGRSTGAPVGEIVRSGPVPESTRTSPDGNRSDSSQDSGPPPARSYQAFQPQQIALDLDVPNVKCALERAAELICRAHGLDPAPVFRAL